MSRFGRYVLAAVACCVLSGVCLAQDEAISWPPALKGAVNGTVTLKSDLFLKVPAEVAEKFKEPGAAPFVVAKTPPTVDLAYHGNLPNAALNGTGWTAWGDICVAKDGTVYSAIGDHGDAVHGKSHAYLYAWDPETKTLKQIVDVNAIVPRKHGEPTWSKVHARIVQAKDGKIYFTGTLNDGNRANKPDYKWSDAITGGQLYRYDPQTGKAELFASLPPARCTATALLDVKRNRWWCNLEAGPNALFAIDLSTGKPFFKAPDGTMAFNRNFALASDGAIYFNGTNGIWTFDPQSMSVHPTKSKFPEAVGMRSSTRESSDGWIYGVTYRPGRLFRYRPAEDRVEMLGPEFLLGDYTTVCVLSPDEKYLYYMPGSHGGARNFGTPAVQYNIATGQRKMIGFMRAAIEKEYQYVPAGTYGVKMSPDGGTLYVNFNGHAGDAIRPEKMRPIGFGLMGFAAIHIPESER